MTFHKGHHNTHDCSEAGRKGKQNSPWRFGNLHTRGAVATGEKIKRGHYERGRRNENR